MDKFLFAWAVTSTILLLRWLLLESKKVLEAQMEKVNSIQTQLIEVRKITISPPLQTEEWIENAVKRCEDVEKTVMIQYNDLVKSPRNYVTARIFGFPTGYTYSKKNPNKGESQ